MLCGGSQNFFLGPLVKKISGPIWGQSKFRRLVSSQRRILFSLTLVNLMKMVLTWQYVRDTELNIFWRLRRKCAHPLRGNRKGKLQRGATLEMSKEIMSERNALIPVGAGIVPSCCWLLYFKISWCLWFKRTCNVRVIIPGGERTQQSFIREAPPKVKSVTFHKPLFINHFRRNLPRHIVHCRYIVVLTRGRNHGNKVCENKD